MSQQQDPYSQLRQRLGDATPGRLWKKTARLTRAEIGEDTELETAKHTFMDPKAGQFVTLEQSTHYLLACGCAIRAAEEVGGLCLGCNRSLRVRLSGRMRLVCRHHLLCSRCRARRRRHCQGGGFWRSLITLLLWPLFDVESGGGGDTPPLQPPYPPYPPPQYPPSSPSRQGNPPPGGPHVGPY
jgi:hypothetical protein